MPAYTAEDYADLANTTLSHFERTTWQDIVVDNQYHIAMPRLLKKKKVVFDSGKGHEFNTRMFTNNAARNVKLNETDNPTTADVMVRGFVPWRHTETHWALETRIMAMNRKPAQLVSLLKTSEVDAMTSLAELMEQNFWGKPSGPNDDVTPWGVDYWITYAATVGFNGVEPSGFSDVGGLATGTYPRWKNYTGQYVSVTKQDLIKKIREAMYKTHFRPPVKHPGASEQRFGLYTVYDVVSTMEEILESQNDNLGNDVASKDGMVHIRRTPVESVPYLDNNATGDPFIGIDWATYHIAFLSGEYMNQTKVKPHPLKHRQIVRYTDCSYNFFCNNRRRQFRFQTA